VLIISTVNCINTTSGIWHCMYVTVWYAYHFWGQIIPCFDYFLEVQTFAGPYCFHSKIIPGTALSKMDPTCSVLHCMYVTVWYAGLEGALGCSKHVENWNKRIKDIELCVKLVICNEVSISSSITRIE